MNEAVHLRFREKLEHFFCLGRLAVTDPEDVESLSFGAHFSEQGVMQRFTKG